MTLVKIEAIRALDVIIFFRTESNADEQMHKYYYFLIQNHLQVLMQQGTEVELKVEAFVRTYMEAGPSNVPLETNVWKKLSHDLMIASAI